LVADRLIRFDDTERCARAVKSGFAVLALVTDAFGGHGGMAQYNRDFFGALVNCGLVSSLIVLPRYAPNEVVTPTLVRQVAPRIGRAFYVVAAIREALFRPVDVVFCGHLFMAPLALLIARLKQAKLIIQMHGYEAWQRPTSLCRRAVEGANLVICVSRYTRAQVLNWATIAPERVLVLPNTVSAIFTPGDGSKLRTAWGLQKKRVLLTVARMSAQERYKGHDHVIRAIPKLVNDGHDVVYVIVGEGDDRARLQLLTEKEGVASRVYFMGALNPVILVDAYRMADLFVMPSTGEGFGIAFLEAMACGTRALGLAVGGAVDVLDQDGLGKAVKEHDFISALEQALDQGKPNTGDLIAAVLSRFGRMQFEAGTIAALLRLKETA
jgi:phosphatidylinositol alpha-1,6-mannosyltransferase